MQTIKEALAKQWMDQLDAGGPYYAVRLKNIKGLEYGAPYLYDNFVKDFDRVIFSEEGEEGTSSYHIHAMVRATSRDEVNDSIQAIVEAKGNKQLSITEVKSPRQCMKYTLKEGRYKFHNFPRDLISLMYDLSNKKENLKKKVIQNEEALFSNSITIRQFMVNYLKIVVDHGQNIYTNHIKAYFTRIALKSGAMYYTDFIESFMNLELLQ